MRVGSFIGVDSRWGLRPAALLVAEHSRGAEVEFLPARTLGEHEVGALYTAEGARMGQSRRAGLVSRVELRGALAGTVYVCHAPNCRMSSVACQGVLAK